MKLRQSRRRGVGLLAAVLLSANPIAAGEGEAALVADIEPSTRQDLGLAPQSLTSCGSTVFFSSRGLVDTYFTQRPGWDLWVTDGTASGTRVVHDFLDRYAYGSVEPILTVVSEMLVFSVKDSIHGEELWAADTTGARLIGDLCPGSLGSRPRAITSTGDTAFVIARRNSHWDDGLWVTDGTADGTRRITTAPDELTDDPANMVAFGGSVFFAGTTWSEGSELWISDGTDAGTSIVKDINPGSSDSLPSDLAIVGGLLFFSADGGGSDGRELWRSDGTPGGTWRVKDILPGSAGSDPGLLTPVCSALFFTADDGSTGRELWVSDGTELGTALVADLTPGPDGSVISLPTSLACDLAFTFDQGKTGTELWVSDGSDAGTAIVIDLNPGPASAQIADPVVVDGVLFFSANDGKHGSELWGSNGTEAGTWMVAEIEVGPAGSSPAGLIEHLGSIFFHANRSDTGRELWRSDGTAAGTEMITDVTIADSSEPSACMGGRDLVYCSAWTQASGFELWVSDGTATGTRMTREIDPDLTTTRVPLAMLGDRVFFASGWGSGLRPWISDGTELGTFELASVMLEPDPELTEVVDDVVYFKSSSGALWRTDGTVVGTVEVAEVGLAGDYTNMVAMGGIVYFAGYDPVAGVELWRSDGTGAGTYRVADLEPGSSSSYPISLTVVNGMLLFRASSSEFGDELWRSDGTEPGTTMVEDIYPGVAGSDIRFLTAVGDVAFFLARDSTHGQELWRTDGTAVGTYMVKDICVDPPDGDSCYPNSLVAVDDRLFFWHNDGVHGNELWVSDGTADGTTMVIDLIPGPGGLHFPDSKGPRGHVATYGSHVYFMGLHPDNGFELVCTDGSPDGTEIFDLYPGPGSSQPGEFAVAGDRLFFSANDPVNGRELWSLDFAMFRDGFEEGTTDSWSAASNR